MLLYLRLRLALLLLLLQQLLLLLLRGCRLRLDCWQWHYMPHDSLHSLEWQANAHCKLWRQGMEEQRETLLLMCL